MLAWMQNSHFSRSTKVSKTKLIGLILGPVLFFILLVIPVPEGLPEQGKLVAGITLWLVVWWVTEAVSIYATALLPLALFPITGGLITTSRGSRIHEPNNYSPIGGCFWSFLQSKNPVYNEKLHLGLLVFLDIHPRE